MPSNQELTIKLAGIWLNPSQFSECPEGAMSIADNVFLDRESIVETRRGFGTYGIPLSGNEVDGIYNYGTSLLVHTDTGNMYYDSDNAGTWVQYPGAFERPFPNLNENLSLIRSIEANRNFYIDSSTGIWKIDSLTSNFILAGAPKGLGGVALPNGATGFLPPETNVAYRIVWGYKDLNGNLILGPPSERIIASNTSATDTCNVELTFQIPFGIDTNWFYQVYRSPPSENLDSPPNDNLQQCFEENPTAGELTGELITFIDVRPSDLLEANLYSNPPSGGGAGIESSKYRPPFANDIASFKGFAFYANTRTLQRLNLTLISSEPPLGIQIGDTITFTDNAGGSFTVTGAATENQTTGDFQVFNTGDPALDIQNTSQSLIKILNLYTNNTFLNGYYTSDFNSNPGQMMFEKIDLNPETFYVNTNRGTAFNISIQAAGQDTSSTNDAKQNRLYFSQFQEPEAVPLLNFLNVGSENFPIDRILPLRDSLIILKKDGIFRLFGNQPTASGLVPVNQTVKILAPASAAVLDNQVYFLSDQGIVACSENDVQILSRPIENVINQVIAQFPDYNSMSYGVAYESDRKYILGLPTSTEVDIADQEYTYNYITNQWTRWTREMRVGLVNVRDGKLYLGVATDDIFGLRLRQERKSYTIQDYFDEVLTGFTITQVLDRILVLNTTENIEVGDTIAQTTSANAQIVSIIDGTQVMIDQPSDFALDAAFILKPIVTVVQTIPQDIKNPGVMKQIREMGFIFDDANFTNIAIVYNVDRSNRDFATVLTNSGEGQYGEDQFGTEIYGGSFGGKRRLRMEIPKGAQRCNWITTKFTNARAGSSLSLTGISVVFTVMSERQGNN